jgi:threonine synthase
LYFPETITPLSSDFFDTIENLSNEEIALKLSNNLLEMKFRPVLKEIIADTLCFDFPVVEVEKAFIP